MKYYIFSILIFFIVETTLSQKNKVNYQVGEISLIDLKEASKLKSFKDIYNYYEPDSVTLHKLNNSLIGITFKLFYGEWCYDSKILVPKIIKVMDFLNVSEEKVEIIGVYKKKNKPKKAIRKNKMEYVPTLIVLRNDVKIGKIVEVVDESIENDILKVIQQKT